MAVFPARYMVSGLKSEHVFKMAARVCSTSSEEMASINLCKIRQTGGETKTSSL